MLVLLLLACHGASSTDDTDAPAGCASPVDAPTALDFGITTLGKADTKELDVAACGDGGPATVTIEGDDAFTAQSDEVDTTGGIERPLYVVFFPTDYASHTGTLRLHPDDGDDVTVALSGVADSDGDGDGYVATGAGGDDCDDSDPDIHPGVDEVTDEVDNDCDGRIDETFAIPGDVVVVEVMADPTSATGEYVELRNTGRRDVHIDGWTLSSGTAKATISPWSIPGGGLAVVAFDTDKSTNGGATVMAGLSTDLALATSDTLTLAVEDTVISTVTYTGAPHATSIGLDPDYVGSPDDMAGWCPQTSTYGAGDHGTPGDPNDGC